MADELASGPAIAENALTTETTEVVETTDAAESAPASPEPAVPERDKVQERFDKLTREKYEALRAADTARYENERLNERLRALETKPVEVVPQELPTLEQFDFDESKYRAAMMAYSKAEARREAQSVLREEREQLKQVERDSTFNKRQQEFQASKPDYAEKVMRPPALGGPVITSEMADVIRDSELGPNIAYYLAENTDKALAIAQLSPLAQAREIGRIEARIEAEKARPAPVVSKAPPPPPSIEGSEPSITVKPDSPDSDEKWDAMEWAKRRNKQLTSRR